MFDTVAQRVVGRLVVPYLRSESELLLLRLHVCPIALQRRLVGGAQEIGHEELPGHMDLGVLCRDLSDETARDVARVGAEAVPFIGARDEEAFFCSRHRDVPEAPFFLELVGLEQGPRMRKYALLRTGDDDVVELESF